MIKTRDEVYAGVRDLLVESLTLLPDEIREESRLVEDLGAESFDALDIVFRLEKKFGIRIRRGEFIPDFESDELMRYTDGVGKNGRLNDEGLRVLRERYPQYDWNNYSRGVNMASLMEPLCVKHIVNYVEDKLEGGRR